ncbi:DUF2752 domain-containing protein [Changchengzhania lutea]|uniref:DUF2752 domain-containing protein n=1 Tax=Changchengzhania lutea TaxID=2049305 RepID=UPI0029393BDF|nr:DUF2752 domain-containing protein [Changchengzhania lutea]
MEQNTTPLQVIDDYMLPCINKQLFGVECLGCGLQRAVSLLFQGDLIGAFYRYPAIYPLIFLFIYLGLNFFFKFKNSNKVIRILAISSVLIIIISYIIKLTY